VGCSFSAFSDRKPSLDDIYKYTCFSRILCYTILVLWGILDSFGISQNGNGETVFVRKLGAEIKISISAHVHLLQHS
jgi:hypothetical protein